MLAELAEEITGVMNKERELTMAVLLKNLVARTPRIEDLNAISGLIVACEGTAEAGGTSSSLEDVQACWQHPDFHLANDAWVIVTTRGQIVGFACLWHEDHTQISTFVCVHPAYRKRGIGTLLLRLAEERARQHIRLARPGERVVLRCLVGKENEGAQHLFEREGYWPGRQFMRISFLLSEDTTEQPCKQLRADASLEQGQPLGVTPLYDQDGQCVIHLYRTYEKELRPAAMQYAQARAS